MIILFGSRAGHLKTLKVPVPCRNCNASTSVELIVYQRFAHIFWIPIFPTKKILTSQCFQCKNSLDQGEFKSLYPQVYQESRKKLRSPFWSFTGLALVASVILLITVISYVRNIKNQFMIQLPKSGDIYKYVSKNGDYSLMKVSEVRGDTVYILYNSYTTKNVIGMRKLMNVSLFHFNKESSPMLRSDLVTMFENDEIMNIERE